MPKIEKTCCQWVVGYYYVGNGWQKRDVLSPKSCSTRFGEYKTSISRPATLYEFIHVAEGLPDVPRLAPWKEESRVRKEQAVGFPPGSRGLEDCSRRLNY